MQMYRRMLMMTPLALMACGNGELEEGYEEYDPAEEVTAPGEENPEDMAMTEVKDDPNLPWMAGEDDGERILAGLTDRQIGRWQAEGHEAGLDSGDALCRQLGADHACMEREIRAADARGEFAGIPDGASFFVPADYLRPDPSEPVPPPNDRTAAGADTCGAYTYPTADRMWSGSARGGGATSRSVGGGHIVYDIPQATDYDLACLNDVTVCAAYVPTGYGCNIAHAIACCY